MSYLFTCPHCQTRTEVDDEYSGHRGQCVVCGRDIEVPDFAPGRGRGAVAATGVEGSGPADSAKLARPGKPKRSVAWVAAAVVLLLLTGAIVIAVARVGGSAAQKIREGREQIASIRNLEKIAAALNAYAADHGAYPAPAITSGNGKPLLSWRVLILPYLGEEELYDQFDLKASWDSEQNQMLTYRGMPAVYRHPQTSGWATDTVYHLITGSGTLFPKSGPLGPKQVTDGATKTLLCVEARVSSVWTEPVDLDSVTAGGTINAMTGKDMGGVTDRGVCVVTVDGRGHFLPETSPVMTVQALITPRGGEPLADDVLD